MKRFKYVKLIIIILLAVVVCGSSFVWHSLYHESLPAYRPMIFYDGNLFWSEKIADVDVKYLEYIGIVSSCVSNSEKPDDELECNTEAFMNGKLYRDDDGSYYVYCTNGKLLLLNHCL